MRIDLTTDDLENTTREAGRRGARWGVRRTAGPRILRGMLPALRAGGPSSRGPMKPGNARPDDPTRTPGQLALELPSALPSLALEPEWKAQARLWGHTLHPMCSYLASFPAALAHAFIARYSRPGDVVLDPFAGRGTAPVQAAAEGRIGVGNDLNPLAHVLTAAKLEPATLRRGAHAARGPAARLGRRGRSLARPRRSGRRAARPPVGVRAGRRQRRRPRCPHRARPRRGQRRVPPADARPAAARPLATSGSTTGRTGSSPARWPGSSTARRRPTCRRSCPTRSAWRRATSGTSWPAHGLRSRPSATCSTRLAAKLDRLYRQPLPASTGIASLGDARTAGRRSRAALRARGLPDRARLVVTSPPYLRVLKYGYYNWLRTWLLGFDARAIDAALDDAHHREPVPRVHARRARRPPAGPHRRRHRGPGHRRRRDRPRQAVEGGARRSPSASGRRPRTRRATGSPGSSGTRSRPTAR